MANFETLDADVNLILDKHYTSGRAGRSIDKIVLHHNAGNLTTKGCYDVWQTRQASAHYQVESSGTIGQLVWDSNTAWHAGNLEANYTSIGIEHADISTNPWAISDACLENGAHLTAALCKYYGLGRPQWGKNVFGHSDFSSTQCPASIAGSQKDAYMKRAGEWYDAMVAGTDAGAATPSQPSQGVDLNALADAVIRGEYGNGDERRQKLGDYYDDVMAIVNARLLGTSSSGSKKSNDEIAQEVINGSWGNGSDRVSRLTAAGYDYNAIQAIVNQKLGATSTTSTNNLDTIAQAVIRGDYGNGQDRINAVTAAGYDYNAVQARVNQLLGW